MIDPYARAAFANGYAEVGWDAFPMPPRVHRALDIALEAARANADDPHVLEAARKAGRFEALLVSLDAKRDGIETKWSGKLVPVLADVAAFVAPLIAGKLAEKPAQDEAVAPEQDPKTVIEGAMAALVGTDVWASWTQVTRDAWVDGIAVGHVIGDSLLADARGEVIPSFDHAFQAALDALADLGDEWNDLDTWMGKMTEGLGAQLGAKVSDAIAQGADYHDLLSLVTDTITGDGNDADLMLNHMLATGTIEGAQSVYVAEGVEEEDVLLSEDACDDCAADADQNPWPVGTAPMPEHPRCRCSVAPHV